jgi:hypothetical protein
MWELENMGDSHGDSGKEGDRLSYILVRDAVQLSFLLPVVNSCYFLSLKTSLV